MLIPNQTIEITIGGRTIKYYKSIGYKDIKSRQKITIPIEDLIETSHEKILVECDYCKKIFEREYRNYITLNKKNNGLDLCHDCATEQGMINIYGVNNAMKVEEIKNRLYQSCQEKYGTKYVSQLPEIREKIKQTCLKNYGVEYPSQSDVVKEKIKKTCMERYGTEYYLASEDRKRKTKEFYNKFYPEQDDNYNPNYLEIEVKSNKKNNIFNQLITEIKKLIKSENVLSFENDRQEWCEMLEEMMSHLIMTSYTINTIDELCLNLTGIDICYDKSFIKMFEILYKESFADIPYELWPTYKPHIQYIEKELKLDIKCNKYLNNFNKYFHKIHDETLKSVVEKIPQEDILKINITDKMYEQLSDIVFNLYINISKKIACNQLTYAYFGKSTRIQFIQLFQALMDCSPRLYVFSKSQRMILHYVLLSKKVINESIKIVEELDYDNTED